MAMDSLQKKDKILVEEGFAPHVGGLDTGEAKGRSGGGGFMEKGHGEGLATRGRKFSAECLVGYGRRICTRGKRIAAHGRNVGVFSR